MNVLRNELASKQIQIVELETRVRMAEDEKGEFATKYQNLQSQLVAHKK